MKKDRFEELLKQKMEHYQPTGPVPAWEEMERRMLLAERANPTPRGNLHLRRWLSYVAAVLVCLSAGLGLYKWQSAPVEMPAELATLFQEQIAPSPMPTHEADPLLDKIAGNENPLNAIFRSAKSINTVTESPKGLVSRLASLSEAEDKSTFQELPTHYAANLQAPAAAPKTRNENAAATSADVKAEYYPVDWGEEVTKRKKAWYASVYSNNIATSGSSSGRSSTPLQYSASLLQLSGNRIQPDVTAQPLRHRFPVSVGINFRRSLSKGFGVETGIVYSYLESDSELSGAFNYKYRQQLHYIGIPLSLTYSMIQTKSLDFYASAGIMLEKAIVAKGTVKTYNDDILTSITHQELHAKGVLWSLNAGVGLGYNFIDNFGIYVEPGIGYYLNPANQPKSYRTDHPVNFNVRAGFRVKF